MIYTATIRLKGITMIYVYQILRQIRLNNSYISKSIARDMNISEDKFRKLEASFSTIPTPLLTNWLQAVGVPKADYEWYKQKHSREIKYQILIRSITGVPFSLLERIADVLALNTHLKTQHIEAELRQHTMPYLLIRPRSAEVSIEDIKEQNNA